MNDLIIAVQGTKMLLASRRLWLGPDRIGWLIEVLEWVSAQETQR